MNHHQLLEAISPNPKHLIHMVVPTPLFQRWLTLTVQDVNIGGLTLRQVRIRLLDQLYRQWQEYRDQNIEQTT